MTQPTAAQDEHPRARLRSLPAWGALEAHYRDVRDAHLRQLFRDDSSRAQRFAAEGAGLYLDYSKNRLTAETMRLLLALADECGLRKRRDAMFRGDAINTTEHRPALHTALRAPAHERL